MPKVLHRIGKPTELRQLESQVSMLNSSEDILNTQEVFFYSLRINNGIIEINKRKLQLKSEITIARVF